MVGGCPGTLASSTTKTGRHDIAEILLKVALKHQKIKNKSTRMLVPNFPSTTAWDHTSDPSSKSTMCPNGILAVGCIPIGPVVILIMIQGFHS
jgi:hypothetical protein